MAIGDGRRVHELEAEVANLKQWIGHLQGTDQVSLARQTVAMRNELAQLRLEADHVRAQTTQARAEEFAARAQLVEDLDIAALQEAGYYTFNHPLSDAVAYRAALTSLQTQMKAMIRSGQAVDASTNWTVNNSAAQGRKMVKDMSTLMLRAYNAEADAIVRNLKPHATAAAKSRLDKTAFAIERLGKQMSIRIAPAFHALRFREIELTADYVMRKQQEREEERERRAELREQAKAAAEMAAALEKLRREQQHYRNLIARLGPDGDPAALAEANVKLTEIGGAISGVEQRAANIRTGHVYVISNLGAFGPDMVKIGMTRRLDPYARVTELGDASVPFRFDVHAMVFHEDAVGLESRLHQALADRKVNRVNSRREFFYASPQQVRELLATIAGAHLVEYHEVPEALEWRASGSIEISTQGPSPSESIADLLEDAVPDDDTSPDDESADNAEPADLDDGDLTDALDLPTDSAASEPAATGQDSVGAQPPSPAVEIPASSAEAQPVEAHPASTTTDLPALGLAGAGAAGWYPDPANARQWRFWDGSTWTSHTSPR